MRFRAFQFILIACLLVMGQTSGKSESPTPYLVRDLNTQISADSEISTFMEAGAVSYLIVSGSSSQSGLWKTDGTPAGTLFLKDLIPDYQYGWENQPNSGMLDGVLFFDGCDAASGECELWKTDGTPAGTVRAADLRPGADSSYPKNFTSMGGSLYFFTLDGLWRLDSADSAPSQVIAISPTAGLSSIDSRLWVINDRLYFSATDAEHGQELWASDGTRSGTTYLIDLFPGEGASFTKPLFTQDGKLYFAANDGPSGFEMWVYDQQAGSAQVLSDVNAYFVDAISMVEPLGNLVVFRACQEFYSCQLYLTDGKTSHPLFDQHPELAPANPTPLGNVQTPQGEKLLFWGQNNSGINDLWVTNGSEAFTSLLYQGQLPIPRNFLPSSYHSDAMSYNGRLYFNTDDLTAGTELWVSDGTTQGTNLFKDIRPGLAGSQPNFLGRCGGWLCFAANDGAHGTELWRTDGTPANTQLVSDLNMDSPGSAPREFVGMGRWVNFVADDGAAGPGLYRTDGTAANTTRLWQNPVSPAIPPMQLTVVESRLYFVTNDLVHGEELWVYDEAQASPRMVKDVAPGTKSGGGGFLTPVGDTLFFIADDSIHGAQVWKTNGTAEGTIMLTNLPADLVLDPPRALLELDGNVLFFVIDRSQAQLHVDMWVTDGTPAGTRPVAEVENVPRYPVKAAGKWFFYTYSRPAGRNIPWQTDGTPQGTHPIPAPACLGAYASISEPSTVGGSVFWVDGNWDQKRETILKTSGDTMTCVTSLPMGDGDGYIQGGFFDYNGKGIFTYIDSSHRFHTWVTDGTATGTHVLPGDPARAADFRVAGPYLYMRAYSAESGSELYVWDGSSSPPGFVADIAAGTESAYPADLFAWNRRLYFSARDGQAAGTGHGDELWAYDITLKEVFLPVIRR